MTYTEIGALDRYMPLRGNYFHATGKTTWNPISADGLAALLASDHPPEFRTVLCIVGDNRDDCPDEGWPVLGPMYFDLDSANLAESIQGFRNLLAKLQGTGLDLAMCRLFASGVKGFHIEIPMECFMPSIPDAGLVGLHRIYKEMAFNLWVDSIDGVVYSGRSGRMWRVPNRQRSSGTYKVPLTVDEALGMDAGSYAELVSAPRPFPPLKAPELCAGLAAIYEGAQDKATRKVKAAGKASAGDSALIARFGSRFPPVLAALGQGRFPAREGRGWNQIVIQLAAVAHALGIDEDATVSAFEGLISAHVSDGRYGSPRKREDELRRMYAYVGSSAAYSFSVGGIRSILPQGLRFNDFRGL